MNEDKTPDGAKTVSDLTMLLFLMDTLGFLKYHSLQCDGYTADVIFQGTAIGINYKMAKRNMIPVNRFFLQNLTHTTLVLKTPVCYMPNLLPDISSRPRNVTTSLSDVFSTDDLEKIVEKASDLRTHQFQASSFMFRLLEMLALLPLLPVSEPRN